VLVVSTGDYAIGFSRQSRLLLYILRVNIILLTREDENLIIEGVSYVPVSEESTCSMSACLTMLLQYYNQPVDLESVSNMFGYAFLSSSFRDWSQEYKNSNKLSGGETMACALYLLDTKFRYISADIIETDMGKIRLSYVKRDIPVIITGRFPMLTGAVPNTVLIKGYVDNYIIVNDPKGNAMSGYVDKFGENMVYNLAHLSHWTTKEVTHILRILPSK